MILRYVAAAWHERWRQARVDAGYSSAEKLAAEVGAHRLTATAWETGRATPSQHYRHALGGLNAEFAALILELDSETQPVELGQLIRRTVIEVLHEVQFPRLEALEVQVQQRARAETVDEGFRALEAAIDRLVEQLSSREMLGGGSPE